MGLLRLRIRLKNHLFLYACQLIFCNLYAYDSEKRPLYVKQLTPLTPSYLRCSWHFFFSSLRGLILDIQKGNILKIDKDGFILRLVLKLCATKPFAVSGMASVLCHLIKLLNDTTQMPFQKLQMYCFLENKILLNTLYTLAILISWFCRNQK